MTDPYRQLSSGVQRWLYRQGWKSLRAIQEEAIPAVLSGRDVIIAAGTASGKTEAAFLPVLSAIEGAAQDHLKAVYVAPLKALINDQERRLVDMCEPIGASVTPWHGDVTASRKSKFFKAPSGLLLITPESLEALFVNRGTGLAALFAEVDFFVIDELHAFIGSERGRQLQSLLHRIETLIERRVPRIALSATLGDIGLAADFLRPGDRDDVIRVESNASNRDLRLQIRGYEEVPAGSELTAIELDNDGSEVEVDVSGGFGEIAEHIYATTVESTNIVFANSRGVVEVLADRLRILSEEQRMPNRYLPHHGSLSKEIRSDAEAALQSGRPVTVIATTTLEMGIDFGSVRAVGQVGAPPSVASLRQRLGRSGRGQDEPSIIRIYIVERRPFPTAPLTEHLHLELVQSVAMVRLMLQKWIEPPRPAALHLSTLVQQVLSQIAQTGGIEAAASYRTLCATGPFNQVSPRLFADLLRDLAAKDYIVQLADGALILGLTGEKLVNRFDFYASFETPQEWRLLAGSTVLGTIPIVVPLRVGEYLIFAGRRWKIVAIDEDRHDIELVAHRGGRPPRFNPGGFGIHDRVAEEMRATLMADDEPAYVDAAGNMLLREAREAFRRLELDCRSMVVGQGQVLLYPWVGTDTMTTMALLLKTHGINAEAARYNLLIERKSLEAALAVIPAIQATSSYDPVALIMDAKNLKTEKHHNALRPELIAQDYASSRLDLPAAQRALGRLAHETYSAPTA